MATVDELRLLCRALYELEYDEGEDALVWHGTPEDPTWDENTEGCLRTADRAEPVFAVTFDEEGKLYSAGDLARPLVWWVVELAPYYLEEWELENLEEAESVSAWIDPDGVVRLVCPRPQGGYFLYSLREWASRVPAACEAAEDGAVHCRGQATGWTLPPESRPEAATP